jgi:hypothetical protein
MKAPVTLRATARLGHGEETLTEIARSYVVSHDDFANQGAVRSGLADGVQGISAPRRKRHAREMKPPATIGRDDGGAAGGAGMPSTQAAARG